MVLGQIVITKLFVITHKQLYIVSKNIQKKTGAARMFLAERWESCLINVDDESSKVFLRCRRTEMRICLLTKHY